MMKCPGQGIKIADGKGYIPKDFSISHDSLEATTTKTIPKFKFYGRINSVNCAFAEPFEGYIIKSHSELQIKSVEI